MATAQAGRKLHKAALKKAGGVPVHRRPKISTQKIANKITGAGKAKAKHTKTRIAAGGKAKQDKPVYKRNTDEGYASKVAKTAASVIPAKRVASAVVKTGMGLYKANKTRNKLKQSKKPTGPRLAGSPSTRRNRNTA